MALTVEQKLAAAVTSALDPVSGTSPYFGAVLRGLIRRPLAVGTLAVTDKGTLLYDPAFVSKTSIDDLRWALEHEVLHVVLKHADRRKSLAVPLEHTELWNFACDSVINDQLREGGRPIASWAIFPEKLGQPKGLTAEESYRRLVQQAQQQQAAGGGAGEGGGGDQPQQGDGAGKGQVGAGKCGSCSGHAHPDEPNDGEPTRTPAEIEGWRREVAEAVREAASSPRGRGRGTVPGDLARWAEEYLKPPKIDWRTRLGAVVREAIAYKAGMVDLHWGRVSRRQAGLGFGPGVAVVPAYRAPVPRVACVVDTSGSMGSDQLQDAISETAGILSAVGSDVTFVACDAAVHELQPIKDPMAIKDLLKGGGGTAMAPAFEALSAERERPEVVIVFTDGYIDHFAEPNWCRTIWVIVGGNTTQPNDWGDTIVVEADADKAAALKKS